MAGRSDDPDVKWIAIPVLTLVAIVVAACGGGSGEASSEEYFHGLEVAIADFIDETNEVAEARGFLVDLENVEGSVFGYRRFLPEMIRASEEFRAELAGMGAPASAEQEHEAAVAAMDGFIEVAKELYASVGEIKDSEALGVAFVTYSNAADGFGEACRALQAVAAADGVHANLRCAS